MKTLIEKVKTTIETNDMLQGVNKVIIAFSSGPDSVCLLDILHRLYTDKIRFHLVYINHGLRPKKYLNNEEKLTKTYATRYHVDYSIIRVNVKKSKIGIEAAARQMRYKTLLNHMKEISAQRIALGHNLDDVVETFLMNLLRGSGARGLLSIPPVRVPFIRPLMNLKKKEILLFLSSKNLHYSSDETNIHLNYRRNLLRSKIIPQLLKMNPDLHETSRREIEILKQDDEYLEERVEKVYERLTKRGTHYISLDLKSILRYNSAVIKRVFMRAIKELRGSLDSYESKHFDSIIGLKLKESGKVIDLPKGLYARREYGDVVIGFKRSAKLIKVPVETEGDVVRYGNDIIKTRTVLRCDLKRLQPNREVFDMDELKAPLFIRNRRTRDFIQTKVGKKKMKKIYSEFKIPMHKRDDILMLCDQKGILWILGIVRAFRGFITKKTKRVLVVEFERID
ncbi:MAG: tRNA lysidine(34) synthetase TilS [candidate division WOR-3 bacterium]|nr:MAG: tRNA lysidine(34) synthetase TilS [candidate division WOR-3 bacterium]